MAAENADDIVVVGDPRLEDASELSHRSELGSAKGEGSGEGGPQDA